MNVITIIERNILNMQSDIIMGMGLDLPERGLDLAKLVFDVAVECDTTGGYRRSIDINVFLDEVLTQIEIARVRHENPNLPEEEIQKLVDAIIAENNRKKEELAAAKAAKRERVKQLIHGNASEGYELAYRLCKEDNSDEAKELAYRMVHRLKSHSIEEQIDICCLYAESLINLGKGGNEVAKVYCQMAHFVYPQSKRADYSLCLSFYEKALEYIDEPNWVLDEIIGFCNSFGINELRAKCEEKKEFFNL